MYILEYLIANWADVLTWLTSTVGFFSLVAVATPNKTDDKIMGFALEAINFLGGNWGNATNK